MQDNQWENRIPSEIKIEGFEKAFDAINTSIKESSETFSTRCRYVVTSLLVFIWGLLFKDVIQKDWCVLTLIVLLLVYFFVDIMQYMFVVLAYKKHHSELNKALNIKGFAEKQIEQAEKNNRKGINDVSFYFFITKSILLLPIFVGFSILMLQILKNK